MIQNSHKEGVSSLYQSEQFKAETKAQLTDCSGLFLSQQLKERKNHDF
jgi:hypothetical protein